MEDRRLRKAEAAGSSPAGSIFRMPKYSYCSPSTDKCYLRSDAYSGGGGRLALRDLTVKERILLHLFDYNRFSEDYEAPEEVTQRGIAKAVGIRVRHVSQYVKPLIAEDFVEGRTRPTKQEPRRRMVYFLKPRGRNRAASLRSSLLEKSVPFRTRRGETRELTLSRVLQEERRGGAILDLLEELRTQGFITESSRPAISGFTEVLGEAPVVEEFHGRQEELAEVLRSIEQAPVVVVTGMAGVGKSTLAVKVCESLRGKRSLFWRSIRPWDTPTDLARRLAGFLKHMGRTGLFNYLNGSGGREMARVEDLLASDLGGATCLLVLDDVHHASEETRAFLALLARVLYDQRGTTALLLSRTIPEFYGRREVMMEETVTEISLGGLDPESSRALLRKAGFDSSDLEDIVRATAGTPLFLKLLARSGGRGSLETGWDALGDYIAEEIEPTLADQERRLLQVASFYLGPVPEAGLSPSKRVGRRTVLNLQKRGLLDRSETGGFALHEFLRDFFQENLPSVRRDAILNEVIPWLQGEAETARTGGRPQDAISYMENAIAIETEPQRRIRSLELLARARRAAGDDLGALDAVRSALQEVDRDEDRARLHRKIAIPLFNLRRLEESEKEIERGLKLVPSDPSLESAWLLTTRANVAYAKADFRMASRDLTTVVSWMPELPEDLELKRWVVFLEVAVNSWYPKFKEFSETRDEWRRVLELTRASSDNPHDLFFPLIHLTLSTLAGGEAEEGMELLRRTMELGEGDRAEFHALALLAEGWYLLEFRGDYEAAGASLERSYAIFSETTMTWRIPWFYRNFANLYWRQGRLEEARESLEHFLKITPLPTSGRIENLSLMVRLCVEGGDMDSAKTYLQEATDMESRNPSPESAYFLEWAKAAVDAQQGEPEKADSHFLRAVSLEIPPPTGAGNMVERLACTRSPGQLLLDFGRFLVAEGVPDQAEELLTRARDAFRALNRTPWEREAQGILDAVQSARISSE